ncbi:hypothetical protein Pcinc_024733 [Petrolisthes cinctipes]|uniref:CHK kinase-like domain-containing protein n=1 Tax=Petrolisthes cinctipes TaxID=88211 RepID=A0AAE1FAI9_PETCI|nr:hypothetical protein Pcinc_024733 [Petrolisthes cinctipes]
MKLILTKDFDHFTDRPAITPEKDNISGQAIGNAMGEEWKILRAILSPTFSSGKVKRMFPLVCQNADTLVTSCLHEASKNPALDMKNMFGRFTMDTIASCAFGIDCSSFLKEKPEFVQMAETVFRTSFSGLVKLFIRMSFPRIARALGISRDGPDVDFFRIVVEETIRTRKESGQCRGDFLDHLLEKRHQNNTPTTEKGKTVLSHEVVLAQCVTSISVGFDTVSSTLYFVSHLLAQHPDQQHRLRQELEALVEEEGQLTYQGIMDAKFLEACINESLRLYPPTMVTARICTKPYQIPGTRIRLRVGDEVIYNIHAVQRDSRFWQHPDKFQPDRFLPHIIINNPITPGSFLPFLMGPRNCIAMRFALMKVKVALSKLLLKSEFKLSPGHENIKMKNWSIVATPATSKRDPLTFITDHHVKSALRKDKGDEAQLLTWNINHFTDNNTTIVTSVVVDYLLGSNTHHTTYIIKLNPCITGFRGSFTSVLFEKEVNFYEEILPELNDMLKTAGQEALRMPELIHFSKEEGNEFLFLKDLRSRGFRLFDKYEGQDEAHIRLVLKELSRLHASSFLLQAKASDFHLTERYPSLDKDWIKCTDEEKEKLIKMLSRNYINAAVILKCCKRDTAAAWVERNVSNCVDLFQEQVTRIPPFEVICHGDIWNDNMLFRYNNDGHPVEVMLIDHQATRVASPITDLINFLYISVKGHIRRPNVDNFLWDYYTIFSSVVQAGKVAMPFTWSELKQEFRNRMIFGLLWCLMFAPFFLGKGINVPNAEDFLNENSKEKMEAWRESMTEEILRDNPTLEQFFLATVDEMLEAGLVDGAPNMSSNMSGESGRSSRPCVGQQVRPEPVVEKTFVESVAGFINEVAPQTYSNPSHYEGKETIIWVKFDYCDINDLARFRDKIEVNGNSPPLLLIVGYTCGVQAWVIPVNGEAMEVLSWRQGAVRTLKILPSPSTSATTVDHYSLKRPIIALCDTAGPGPHFCSVSFISLKTGEQVKIIKFKHPVHDIEANKNVVVIIFSEKLAVFDAATLEDTFTVTTCYPCPGPSVNPIALGDRWLAYADRRLVPLHQSCAGMVPEGTTSYKAKVFDAAKSLTKGLKELSESVASNLMGQRGGSSSITTTTTTQQSPPTTTTNIPTPGIVTIIDTQGVEGGELNLSSSSSSDSGIVAHFCSHQGAPVVALAFDPTGMLLLTADKLGHNFHLFRLQPHPLSSAQSAVHHLYTLHRGDTTAKVTDISFSLDSRWVAVSTHRGTTHVFPITPYGGNIGVRTHTSTCVVNRLSRFHRSAGLDDTPSSGRNSPVLSASPGSSKFGFEVSPTLAYPNPRYPPYPSPTVVRPLVQLRQPILHSLLGTMGTGPSPSRSPPSGKSPRSPSGDDIIKVASVFGSARGWVAGSPTVARDKQRRTMDSLFVMAYHGNLLEYQLEPSPAPSLPQEKITEDSPIQLQVHASAQWSLVRESTSSELRPPLDLTSPLLAPLSPTRPPSLSPAHSLDHDDPEERWMAQVEIHTHAGPHRRLWMGPQFSFKTIPGVTYSTTGGGGCGGGGGGGYYDTSAISAASPLDHPPPRSSPVNMPGSGGANVLIEAGSLTGSHDQSPRLLERNSGDSDSFDPETMMTQLRHDLADAMMDSQHPATHTHTGGGGGCRGWPGAPSRECGLDMTDVMDISCDPPGPSHHHVGDDEIQAVTQVPVTPPSTSARASPHTPSLDDTPPRVLTSSTEELSTTLCPGARHTTNTNTNVSDSVWVPIERPTQHNKSSSAFSPEFVELDRPPSQGHTNTHTQRLSPKVCQSSAERLMPASGRRTHDATTHTRQQTPSTATTTTAAACVVITSSSTHNNNNKSECMIELGSSLGSDSEEKGDSKYKKEQDRDDNNEGDDRTAGNVWRKCVVSSEIPQMYPSLVSKSAMMSASDHESSESHGRLVSSRSKAKQPPSTTGSEDDLWTTTATSDGRKDKRKKKKKNRTSMSQQQGDEEEECESKLQQQQQSQQVVDISTTLTTTTSSNNTPNTQLSSSSLSSQQHPSTDTQHFSTLPLSTQHHNTTTTHTQHSSSSLSTQSKHLTDDNICISNYYERPSQKSDLLSHKSDLLSHKSDPLSHKAEPQQLEMDVDVDYFHAAEEYQEPPPLEERVEELDDLQHQECFLEPQVEELDFEEAREMVVQTLEDFELHPEEEDEEKGEREKKKVETLDEDTSVSGDAMLRSLHDDNDLARALEEAYSSDDNAPTRPLPRPRPRTHSRTRTQSRTRTSEMFPFKDDTSEDEGQSRQQQQKYKGDVGEVLGSGGSGGGGVRRRGVGVGTGTGDETSETSGDDRGESSTDDRRTTTSESDVGASPNPRTTSANKAKKKKKKKR